MASEEAKKKTAHIIAMNVSTWDISEEGRLYFYAHSQSQKRSFIFNPPLSQSPPLPRTLSCVGSQTAPALLPWRRSYCLQRGLASTSACNSFKWSSSTNMNREGGCVFSPSWSCCLLGVFDSFVPEFLFHKILHFSRSLGSRAFHSFWNSKIQNDESSISTTYR